VVGARYGVVVICSCDSGISGDDTDWRLGQTPAAWNAWVTFARNPYCGGPGCQRALSLANHTASTERIW